MQTVSATRRRWLEQGLVGLPDRARSGAPAKLTAAQTQQLLTWARAAPLTLTALKARHVAAGGAPVHVNTLTGVLKRAGFVWKRTRHIGVLRRQGVTLYFLPPYSPELNRVEKLWHLVKHTWMSAKHRDAATLGAEVTEILDQVGTRYHLAF